MATTTIPGQVLGKLSTHLPGAGTHVNETDIYASLAGNVITTTATTKSGKPTVSVSNTTTTHNAGLPQVSSIVLGRVLRVQQRQLIASILTVDPPPSLITPYASNTDDEVQFQAILRREDVRAFEKDKVNMNEMFRVGDIVKASVISLGDERSYYISTAGNEFGVIIARSEVGNPMVPASWKEMKDTVTGKGETRKVAKPT
ncbi:exosome 3'-_5 exonuclease subunit ski4 (Csl4) [Exophiala xenobiotica]|uniref:Exosome 3'->5 exonuclease subunit ski4 (Csl4) n=1 Tax=Lithohypha guttulata TaxID=1690604 RepID=A0ABR0K6V9_9EURO|nr:exosome 3'->5 exonuclease subunit ski4 (Csl4) [Lithohypha guttulata]KAK5315620.1 exosome 3'->5 exonuclease subunit ski4 (Csl4) [Exophiala xenobiotica]